MCRENRAQQGDSHRGWRARRPSNVSRRTLMRVVQWRQQSANHMGQAKLKRRTAFAESLVQEWERDACVNFAVALARITGWLLHVDWWSPATDPDEEVPLERLRALRVYVADNHDSIFDVHGVRTIAQFNERTILPLARPLGTGGIRTRYYSEAAISELPLRTGPDEAKIVRADVAIRSNVGFLAGISPRAPSGLPAHEAARFTYGRCAAFAHALHEYTGAAPVALLANRFSPLFDGTRRSANGYFHSVVLHPDGSAEDSWGKATLQEVARRFGVLEFRISAQEHREVLAALQRNSSEQFEAALADARALVSAYRPREPARAATSR